MQKLGFSSLKSMDQLKSFSKSASGTAKRYSFSSHSPPASISSGSFANLKLTAEKLLKEQATVKADLEMASNKLKRSIEHIHALEAKLQNAFNENVKLKVKQKEDEKLWNGLESKFSSTKILCDQLSETLNHLTSQVHSAERDKEYFEGKLSANAVAVNDLNQKMSTLSLKLESAEETMKNREKELVELRLEKEKTDKFYRDEQCRTGILIEEKDATIRNFEEVVTANRSALESLKGKMGEVKLELKSKEDEVKHLLNIQENLEKEKSGFQFLNDDLAKKLDNFLHEIKNFEALIQMLASQLVQLDKKNLTFLDKFDQLNSLYDTCFKLCQQEKDLAAKHAQKQYDQLHNRFLYIASEKDAMQVVNQELNNKVIELQKIQETVNTKLSIELHSDRERIQNLESEAEILVTKKRETEKLVSNLELQIDKLSETLKSSENQLQELLLKILALETANKDNTGKLQAEMQTKMDEIDALRKENERHEQHIDSLGKLVDQLQNTLEEKEQQIQQYKEREKCLEEQITENQTLLTAAEGRLTEAKKQCDLMLESKQLELSRHLIDLSQRNDQAINDIRKKYEVEKLEIINMEKEKAEKDIREMEASSDKKIAECQEDSRLHLMHVQEEHAALVSCLQQEYDRKELSLKGDHSEELKRAKCQAENELKEKITLLRDGHETEMRALRCQLEDACNKLQEELDYQKSKEERQRALLQLQWKVMGDNSQQDQEVNSKRDYSTSSIHTRNNGGGIKSHHTVIRPRNDEKESSFLRTMQTPVSQLLTKVENANTGSVLNIPKHQKKVTRHEYEVETSNGRTITKRRKTKSTVMFEDPRKNKRTNTPKTNTPRSAVKGAKGGVHPNPSNIGELFQEGSLNPYTEDPYAFD